MVRHRLIIYICFSVISLALKNIGGLVRAYSISSAIAMEIQQSCTQPSIWLLVVQTQNHKNTYYPNQCWIIVNWTPGNKLQWNFNRNSYIFIEETTFENVVWQMAAFLSRPHCVNECSEHVRHQSSGCQLMKPRSSQAQRWSLFSHTNRSPFSINQKARTANHQN